MESKQESKLSRKGKKANPSNLSSNQFNKLKEELQALKKSFTTLTTGPIPSLEMYRDSAGFRDRLRGVSNKYTGRGKAKKLEQAVGLKFAKGYAQKAGMNFDTSSTAEKIEMLETLYADDLGSLLGVVGNLVGPTIRSMVVKYGPQVLEFLLDRVKNKAMNLIKSHGSGQGLVSIPVPTSETPLLSMDYVDSNTVCLQWIASVLCPEKYMCLTPDGAQEELVSANRMSTYDIVSNANGDFIYYSLPDMTCALGGGANQYFYATNTATSTVNQTTGVIGTPAFGAGPFNASGVASINNYRLTAASYRFIPNLAAVNNSGILTLAYMSNTTDNLTSGANPAVPDNSLLNWPYLHIATANGTKEMRQIHVPHAVTDLSPQPFSSTVTGLTQYIEMDGLCLKGSGFPAGTRVGKLIVATQIDYAPGDSVIGLVKPVPTPDAPGSIACCATLVKRLPHITQLDLDDAMMLAEFVLSLPKPDYSYVVQQVCGYVKSKGFKPRPSMSLGGAGGGAGGPSIDSGYTTVSM